MIGDKVVKLGIGVVAWEVPPEMDALLVQEALLKLQADEKARKEAEKTNGTPASPTNGAPSASTNSPAKL